MFLLKKDSGSLRRAFRTRILGSALGVGKERSWSASGRKMGLWMADDCPRRGETLHHSCLKIARCKSSKGRHCEKDLSIRKMLIQLS